MDTSKATDYKLERKAAASYWYAKLTDAQELLLWEKLRHGSNYVDAAQWAYEAFGLDHVPSPSAMGRWRRKYARQVDAQRLLDLATLRAGVEADAKEASLPGDIVSALTMRAMDLFEKGDSDGAKTLSKLVAIAVQRERQDADMKLAKERNELQRRAQELAEKKYESLQREKREATETLTHESLTAEERIDKIKGIFGLS